jgi:hypothetical protein
MADKTGNKNEEIAAMPQTQVEDVKSLILTIRGRQVLLDSDVAMLYGYEKRAINQTAKRNEDRFPERYRFQLTKEEYDQLPSKSQTVILNSGRGSNVKKLPFAYTEHGISMISGLLRNKTAVQVSLGIIDAFVEMREFFNANRDVFTKIVSIDNKLLEHDRKFDEVFDLLQQPEAIKQCIFFKGEFYDAFKLVIELIRQANISITIIDNYADDSVLDMLANKKHGASVTIITSHPNKLTQQHLAKFTAQHGQPTIVASKDFHDRFIALDGKEVYLFGASLKDVGAKCFGVSEIEDAAEFLTRISKIG